MPASITVRIENTKPVELVDFTRSLLALADQFKRDVENDARQDVEVRLYVTELRTGSLVAELAALNPDDLRPIGGAAA